MDFELQRSESAAQGIRRIILERVDYVHELMVNPQPTRETAVHEARKSFKRIRAALRLVREETGREWYRARNIYFRDAGRLLAPVRDSAVLLDVLDVLAVDFASQVSAATFAELHQWLLARSEEAARALLDDQNVMEAVAQRMEAVGPAIAALPVSSEGFEAFAAGLQRVYKRGRRTMKSAEAAVEDPTLFHEWRKQVKYLWYHMEILQQTWPLLLKATVHELNLLSDFLGDAHDLVALRETILSEPDLQESLLDLPELLAAVDGRRRELEAASLTLGQRLFSEPPRHFVARMDSYWQAWRADPPATRAALQRGTIGERQAHSA